MGASSWPSPTRSGVRAVTVYFMTRAPGCRRQILLVLYRAAVRNPLQRGLRAVIRALTTVSRDAAQFRAQDTRPCTLFEFWRACLAPSAGATRPETRVRE